MAPEQEPTPVGHTVTKATGYGAPAMPPTAEEHHGDLPGGFRKEDVEASEDPSGAEASDADDPAAEIDALSGDDLDKAVDAAGIDPTTGGSKSDGGLTADEKRAALKAKRGV